MSDCYEDSELCPVCDNPASNFVLSPSGERICAACFEELSSDAQQDFFEENESD